MVPSSEDNFLCPLLSCHHYNPGRRGSVKVIQFIKKVVKYFNNEKPDLADGFALTVHITFATLIMTCWWAKDTSCKDM